jgi:hypothetical protein
VCKISFDEQPPEGNSGMWKYLLPPTYAFIFAHRTLFKNEVSFILEDAA